AGIAPRPWRVQVGSIAVRSGRVNWLDDSLPSPARIGLTGLTLNASSIAYPFAAGAPLAFQGSVAPAPAELPGPAAPAADDANKALLAFSGTATDQTARLTATVASWPLGMGAAYIAQFLQPDLSGRLDGQLALDWRAAGNGQPQGLEVDASRLSLAALQLADGKASLASARQLALSGVHVDVTRRSLKIAKVELSEPKGRIERDADGRWMSERWLPARADASATPRTPDAATQGRPPATASRWAVSLGELTLDGGAVSFSDKAAGPTPVAFELSAVNAQLSGLNLGGQPATSSPPVPTKLMPLSVSLRLAAGRREPGKLEFKGGVGLTPLQTEGQLTAERLPVHAFEPYVAGAVNIDVLRADASFKGQVTMRSTPAGLVAQASGDAGLDAFRANTRAPREDLLAWKALALRGLKVGLDPGRPTQVDVSETVLTDFFARVIVTPEGRINLQDLLKPPPVAAAASGPDATETVATTQGITRAAASNSLNSGATPNAGPVAAGASAAGPVLAAASAAGPVLAAAAPARITIGPIRLVNGKVLFSDRFVRPNYSADLTELNGRLGAFSSLPSAGSPSMADLELRGRAEGTASLDVAGKLNPLAQPLALDISGKVRDLELPPLSPYAIKYAGYGINRGKLSVDVNYRVLPNGQLTANNKVVLNQLSFGDKVEGSTASLPVKLAVALLADRNGVIDLDLPISGSLNDPQFALGAVIGKVVLNVIVKAITAPFSLLANAFGGGASELSTVDFAPGSAQLTPDARLSLDKVAQVLTDRPSLRLTVAGSSSLEAERDGLRRERLNERVRAEKRRQIRNAGAAGASTAPDAVSVSTEDYPALLAEVYRRADITKPRNAIGITRSLPVAEMEQLLLASMAVDEEAARALAQQRGMAVKDYLATRQLPPDRLFLGASKTVPGDGKWPPRAELSLAVP
ncbi:MAG: hypothetical protein JWP47_2912, partial [Polaromonas sp.]|nr:hypothetical protein [Polaromonas sp.]